MNYQIEFKKFITGQYLSQGVRITVGAIIPALILYHYDWLTIGIAMPLGALMVSLTDTPGPIHHRRNGMLVSNIVNFVMAIVVGYTRYYPWLLAIEITLFSFFFSLVSIYGNRVNSIGLAALLVMVLNIDVHHSQDRIWSDALFMLGGGVWYMLLSLILYSLRPFLLIQQALGASIISVASYLRAKSKFYELPTNYDEAYDKLFSLQVEIQHQQEQLRLLLYKARSVTRESSAKSRSLLMMFLDSIDLFEQTMTSQQDYKSLHRDFDNTDLLQQIRDLIIGCAEELEEIGLAVQAGTRSNDNNRLEESIKKTEDAYQACRDQYLQPGNLEGYISLRHILNSIKDVADRIKRLRLYSTFSSNVTKNIKINIDFDKYIATDDLDPELLLENLSLHSNAFRHALRMSISMLAGYLVAQLFPFGHSYWILLTILTILKPAYSISKKRNAERLGGTVTGAAISFTCLYFIHNNEILFGLTIIAMIIAYSFLQLQYFVSVAGITVYVLLSFHFLHPVNFKELAIDRVIDTAIGSTISFIAAFFFLPKWEHEQVWEYIQDYLQSIRNYFHVVATAYYGDPAPEYKVARKHAYVDLANLSDTFQRSLSEPRNKFEDQTLFHQFVVASHMLMSHTASLSLYAKTIAPQYRNSSFKPSVLAIENNMQKAIDLSHGRMKIEYNPDNLKNQPDIRDTVTHLWNIRVQELQKGTMKTVTGETLSGLKTITDQFEIVQSIVTDIIHILTKMGPLKIPK